MSMAGQHGSVFEGGSDDGLALVRKYLWQCLMGFRVDFDAPESGTVGV
jgi:hypothetical protein